MCVEEGVQSVQLENGDVGSNPPASSDPTRFILQPIDLLIDPLSNHAFGGFSRRRDGKLLPREGKVPHPARAHDLWIRLLRSDILPAK